MYVNSILSELVKKIALNTHTKDTPSIILYSQQRMDHKDIEDLKKQFAVLSGAYTTEKRHREQLERVVASTEHKVQLLEHKVIL